MSGLMRVAFVNTSTKDAVVQIKTQDAVECCQLLASTPVSQPEQNPGLPKSAGAWQLAMPPGSVFGFVTELPVEIHNPNSGSVIAIYANTKDPWPQPPPLTAPDVPDFAIRYQNFLMVAGATDPQPTPIVMTLAPARV
jgi:hypothetical protein